MTVFLYVTTVLIWGSTWIAIYFQVGDVPISVSVFYRFVLSASIFVAVLAIFKKLDATTLKDHRLIALKGCCLFSLNFICFYNATYYISSGLAAVIFSTATIFNAVNNRVFYKEVIPAKVIIAGAIGCLGLVVLFLPELNKDGFSIDTLKGFALACTGTFLFSLGNMISKKTTQRGLSTLTTNAYGMCYGTALLGLILIAMRQPLVFNSEPEYIVSLVYLSIFGTVVAFTTYLLLVARIGTNNAAYCTALFPIVALILSSVFEGYQWQIASFIGIGLTVLGNVVLQIKLPRALSTKLSN